MNKVTELNISKIIVGTIIWVCTGLCLGRVNAAPTMTTPAPGSVFSSTTVTFQWSSNGTSAIQWWLYIGSNQGASDLHDSGSLGTQLSTTVTGLPTDGRQVFVRLWCWMNNQWTFRDYQYAASVTKTKIISPVPGSAITASSVQFKWRDQNPSVVYSWVYVGRSPGSDDIFDSGVLTSERQVAVTTLPYFQLQGNLYVRLSTLLPTGWRSFDYEYRTSKVNPPEIISPTPGSTVTFGTVTFDWTDQGAGINSWQITLGTTPGGQGIYDSGILLNQTSTTSQIPSLSSQNLYATLRYLVASGWQSSVFTYTVAHNYPKVAVRLVDHKDRDEQTLNFLDLETATVTKKHAFGPDQFMRGSDVVPVEIGTEIYGLFQPFSGDTHIYRFSDGEEVGVVSFPISGETGIPGVEPAFVRMSNGGQERVFGISIDSNAQLVLYEIETGQVISSVVLSNYSSSDSLKIIEDVDLLVHGKDGSMIPPMVFVLASNGEAFAVSLPDLQNVTNLGHLEGGTQVAVDPIAMGTDLVVFQDMRGGLLFVDRTQSSLRTYRREPLTQADPDYGTLFYDAVRPEIDIVSTGDGLFGVQLTGTGHAYILDRRKLDPQGSLYGQSLTILKAPYKSYSLIGSDPVIACYNPNLPLPERLTHARIINKYYDDEKKKVVHRIFSMDGANHWTYESISSFGSTVSNPDVPDSHRKTNLDIILGPKDNNGLEKTANFYDCGGNIQVVDFKNGRVLHTILNPTSPAFLASRGLVSTSTHKVPEEGLPVEGVDALRTSDGRYLIVVNADFKNKSAVIYIHGVAPPNGSDQGTFGELHVAQKIFDFPYLDGDLQSNEAGSGFYYTDTNTEITEVDLLGQIVKTIPSSGGNSVPGADLSVPWERLRGPDPDEDWVFPAENSLPDGEPPGKPPYSLLPPLDDSGLVVDPDSSLGLIDPFSGNPGDDAAGTGGGVSVIESGDTCVCEGAEDIVLTDRIESLVECPPGEFSVVNIVAESPADGESSVVSIPDEHGGARIRPENPGKAVVEIRPCVDPNGESSEINTVQPIHLTILVTAPLQLVAEGNGASATVSKGSGPACLTIPCGTKVELTASSCPSECVELLRLEERRTNQRGVCTRNISPPLSKEGSVLKGSDVPGSCSIHKAILTCKNFQNNRLEPIYIYVVGFENETKITGPKSLTIGGSGVFTAKVCDYSAKNCQIKDCKPDIDAIKEQVVWTLTEPSGNTTRLARGVNPDPLFKELTFPDAGTYTLTAKLGNCSLTKTIEVKERTRTRFFPGDDPENPNDPTISGDPIFTHSGEVVETKTDLLVPSRGIPFTWIRRYKSRVNFQGPLGNNWDFNYNEWLTFEDTDNDGDFDVNHVGLNFLTTYERTGDDPLDYHTPDGHFTRLRRNAGDSFSIRYPKGEIHTFRGPDGTDQEGRLVKIEDAMGNFMTFEYQGRKLVKIYDTFRRAYTVAWQNDFIVSLQDFAGRTVLYDYYGAGDTNGIYGDLKSVRTPTVTGTPNGNDFPQGKTTVYTYLTDLATPELMGNLRSITQPNEVSSGGPPTVVFTYGRDPDDANTFDRAITIEHGGTNASGSQAGGTYQYYYEELNPNANPDDLTIERRHTIEVDRNGNVISYFFNHQFKLIKKRIYTGQVDPSVRHSYPVQARGPGLRSGLVPGVGRPGPDPEFYEWSAEYNRHGDKIREKLPEGNQIAYTYPFADDPNPFIRRNLSETRWIIDADRPAALGNPSIAERAVTLTYEPWTNNVATKTDCRGNVPDRKSG